MDSNEAMMRVIATQLESRESLTFGWNGTADEMFQCLKKYIHYPVLIKNITSGHPPNYEFFIIKDTNVQQI